MEWLHTMLAEHPVGHFALAVRHNPYLILLAYLVMCAGSFATLDIIERIGDAEQASARRRWKLLGACCLACINPASALASAASLAITSTSNGRGSMR